MPLHSFSSYSSTGESLNNEAVAEYFKNDIQKFRTIINHITGLDEKASEEINDATDVVAYYNHALIYFHDKKYTKALKVLQAILSQENLLDEQLSDKVHLLAANLYLNTHQYKKADEVAEVLQSNLLKQSSEADSEDEQSIKSELDRVYKLTILRSNLMNGKVLVFPPDDDAEHNILRAHKYYLGHDYQMAAKELARPFSDTPITSAQQGENQNACIANNLGLIHFGVRHFAISVRFLQQALKFDQEDYYSLRKSPSVPMPLHCIAATRRTEILYNLGLALLHLGRPKEAFDCLLIPLQRHQNNPRLWLRLAEACILLHKEKVDLSNSKRIVHKVIHSNIHTKVILSPSPKRNVSKEHQSYAIPSPSIEFAAVCLRNAVAMIDFYGEKSRNFFSDEEGDSKPTGKLSDPSRPLTKTAFERLRYAVLAAYSYVLLAIGDFVLALKYGKDLLALDNLPETYSVLGHLYCAEALIMMNRVTEACYYLEPKFIKSLKGKDFETMNWKVNSLESAQAVLTYNLSVTLAIQGDYKLSKKILMACKHPILGNHFKLLDTYLDLQMSGMDLHGGLIFDKPGLFSSTF